jgi:NAD(P)H-nitrite reductase large subunit
LTISRGDSEIWRGIPEVLVVHDQHEVNRQRLIIKDNRLVGAILVGDQTLSGTLRHLIEEQVNIGPILPALRIPDVNVADLLRRLPAPPSGGLQHVRAPVRAPR